MSSTTLASVDVRAAQTASSPSSLLGLLYENPAWLDHLTSALEQRGLAFARHDLRDAAFDLDAPILGDVVFNRVSPSAAQRGHRSALRYTTALLETLQARGTRVINGAPAFRLETSKVAQQMLLERLGLATPRTLVFNGRQAVRAALDRAVFPAILKPDTGGSGALVRWVESAEHLLALLDDEAELFGPDQLLLLQEALPTEAGIVRLELLDGELLYGMRVHATNTFNLCPAEACERPPAGGRQAGVAPSVDFEPLPWVPRDVVEEARAVVRSAGLDVGGVEYVEHGGRRAYIDVNSTSVYREDVGAALGVDASEQLAAFLEREVARAVARRIEGKVSRV